MCRKGYGAVASKPAPFAENKNAKSAAPGKAGDDSVRRCIQFAGGLIRGSGTPEILAGGTE